MNELDRYRDTFDDELAGDVRFEQAISRRCFYSVAVVIAAVIVRSLWFV